MTIEEIENKLCANTGKTIDHSKYMMYLIDKIKQNEILKEEYNQEYYRKIKWFSYLNKRKHENKLIEELKRIYGEDTIFIVGDWNESEGIKFMSTPGKG